ncbi:hypothetical protein THAOC_00024 [Thalassiosira oceanica]|uniref:Uncharacterized protein n=1 Tax=Thalassiosira oceanica TaxID=159749 RepID=K0TK79_THAOC|nr:hypothetical protein THAOC_00024 [Thalassiosira oceanica]|eukprot:EJK78095.1 hypothetical protein THAOC_00024 [Thalassiosira oceanica]
MVPDLHAYNYPTGGGNGSSTTDSGYPTYLPKLFSSLPGIPTFSKLLKTKKLDDKFAPEIVGDGMGNVMGPFQTMLGRFYRGQVLPVCAGCFGEINTDFNRIIRQLARKAAAGDHGLRIYLATRQQRPQRRRISNHAPPIQTSDRSRNRARERTTQAKQATLRQGHPRGGRADACRANNHSTNIWESHRHGLSNWFSQHTPEGYRTYEQFRNGYDHCVP